MSKFNSLKADTSFTGPELRDMGAGITDDSGIRWIPPDQMIRQHEGSVALKPDPESLRVYFVKRAQTFTGKAKAAVSGPQTKPANALNRMMARPVVKGLMNRLQRRGLISQRPNTYAALKQPALKAAQTPKPQVTAMSIKRMSLNLLHTKPVARAGLKLLAAAALPEPAARMVNSAAKLFDPKPRGYALNFG